MAYHRATRCPIDIIVVSNSKIFRVNFPLVNEKSTCHLVASHCIVMALGEPYEQTCPNAGQAS
ncbi:hypothetical protein T09_5126 [Trichinella sp. T9]|nr:hypothetical protein T09_5126 [Trichinella sp. T9]